MKPLKMRTVLLGVVLSALASSLPASAGQVLNHAVLAVLHDVRVILNGSVEQLSRTATAHQLLAQELGNAMPGDLAQGLSRELKLLEILLKIDTGILPPIIDAEQSIAEEKQEYTVSKVQGMIATVQQIHQQLDTALTEQREARQACKRRLSGVIDALIAANPGKAPTYRGIKADLDPDMLDRQYGGAQKAALAALVLSLDQLK